MIWLTEKNQHRMMHNVAKGMLQLAIKAVAFGVLVGFVCGYLYGAFGLEKEQ